MYVQVFPVLVSCVLCISNRLPLQNFVKNTTKHSYKHTSAKVTLGEYLYSCLVEQWIYSMGFPINKFALSFCVCLGIRLIVSAWALNKCLFILFICDDVQGINTIEKQQCCIIRFLGGGGAIEAMRECLLLGSWTFPCFGNYAWCKYVNFDILKMWTRERSE